MGNESLLLPSTRNLDSELLSSVKGSSRLRRVVQYYLLRVLCRVCQLPPPTTQVKIQSLQDTCVQRLRSHPRSSLTSQCLQEPCSKTVANHQLDNDISKPRFFDLYGRKKEKKRNASPTLPTVLNQSDYRAKRNCGIGCLRSHFIPSVYPCCTFWTKEGEDAGQLTSIPFYSDIFRTGHITTSTRHTLEYSEHVPSTSPSQVLDCLEHPCLLPYSLPAALSGCMCYGLPPVVHDLQKLYSSSTVIVPQTESWLQKTNLQLVRAQHNTTWSAKLTCHSPVGSVLQGQ